MGHWKLIEWFETGRQELYYLHDDLGEQVGVVFGVGAGLGQEPGEQVEGAVTAQVEHLDPRAPPGPHEPLAVARAVMEAAATWREDLPQHVADMIPPCPSGVPAMISLCVCVLEIEGTRPKSTHLNQIRDDVL